MFNFWKKKQFIGLITIAEIEPKDITRLFYNGNEVGTFPYGYRTYLIDIVKNLMEKAGYAVSISHTITPHLKAKLARLHIEKQE